jgi:P27 family predicted phage terminase small subunit
VAGAKPSFALPKLGGKPPLKFTREAWAAYWSSSLPQLLTDADHPALVRLFDLYDQRERMARAFRREPFSTGSTGQKIVNPAARELATLDGRIVALEDRFGITPLARMKLGIAIGEAARSLEDLNREFEEDEDARQDADPRLEVIDTEAAKQSRNRAKRSAPEPERHRSDGARAQPPSLRRQNARPGGSTGDKAERP